ncbi:hypothetical protein SHDE107825_07600 [Shewanella denitrificans]
MGICLLNHSLDKNTNPSLCGLVLYIRFYIALTQALNWLVNFFNVFEVVSKLSEFLFITSN